MPARELLPSTSNFAFGTVSEGTALKVQSAFQRLAQPAEPLEELRNSKRRRPPLTVLRRSLPTQPTNSRTNQNPFTVALALYLRAAPASRPCARQGSEARRPSGDYFGATNSRG